MVMNSDDAPRAGGSIPVTQNWVRRHKNSDLLQRTEEKRKESKMMKSMTHTLVMVIVNTFPPILHPHRSSVLKSEMIKSRFIDCVTWKNLQSFSKPNRFWFLHGKRGVLGISKPVCYACMNPSG